MSALYALTSAEGKPLHWGTGAWPLPSGDRPGEWREVDGELIACKNGLHVYRARDIAEWARDDAILWEAETSGLRIDARAQVVARCARLVRRVGVLTPRLLRLFAADCAEHVLPLFERAQPSDKRPREAIDVARGRARGEIAGADWHAASVNAYLDACAAARYAMGAVPSAAANASERAAARAARDAASACARAAAWVDACGAARDAAIDAASAVASAAAIGAAMSAARAASYDATTSAAYVAGWAAVGAAASAAASEAEREWQGEHLLKMLAEEVTR